MIVAVLVHCDRHTDDDIELFRDQHEAMVRADEIVADMNDDENDLAELNEDHDQIGTLARSGWAYYKVYSTEGDHVRVELKEVK